MTINKEQVYDDQINPLIAQIVEICEENGIAFVSTFAIPTSESPHLACTTYAHDETGKSPLLHRRILANLGLGA